MDANDRRSSQNENGMQNVGDCADRLKILWWDGTGLCLYAKRMERGRFVWPVTREGAVRLTGAQLSMLCEGIDWRSPLRTDMEAPRRAG
jgi:transposase